MHTNQKLLVDLLIKNGASIKIIDPFEELLEVSYQGKKDFLLDRFSSQIPLHSVKLTADKFFTKKVLKENNINVPEGNIFSSFSFNEALLFASNLYPVVLKPNWGSHGDDIVVDIQNEQQLKNSVIEFYQKYDQDTPFLIEKFYPWKEYRLFITHLGDFAVIHRDFSHVIGNGINSIEDLILIENDRRKHLKNTINTSLCPIVIDDEVFVFLEKNKIDLSYIPKNDEKVYLRQESNLAKGGVSINFTQIMPSIFKDISQKALASFPGLKLAGLDLLCNDIYSPNPQYVILEVNSNPGLTMHHFPAIGQPENVAQYVCDVMFPNWF